MGRNRLPDAVKVARGTDQPCRMSGDAGVSVLDSVKAPAFLSGAAKKIFEETAFQLCSCRVLTALDVEQLSMYALNVGRAIEAEKAIKKEGAVITVKTKYDQVPAVNPWVKIQKDAISVSSAIAAQYGLTPVSRMRIAQMVAPEKKEKDPFEEFDL